MSRTASTDSCPLWGALTRPQLKSGCLPLRRPWLVRHASASTASANHDACPEGSGCRGGAHYRTRPATSPPAASREGARAAPGPGMGPAQGRWVSDRSRRTLCGLGGGRREGIRQGPPRAPPLALLGKEALPRDGARARAPAAAVHAHLAARIRGSPRHRSSIELLLIFGLRRVQEQVRLRTIPCFHNHPERFRRAISGQEAVEVGGKRLAVRRELVVDRAVADVVQQVPRQVRAAAQPQFHGGRRIDFRIPEALLRRRALPRRAVAREVLLELLPAIQGHVVSADLGPTGVVRDLHAVGHRLE
mmetsp:Transcript_41612/g.110400  ORF Transcript_41612/g.110400 Transcript_41612/m.110400 type:complete len:304 (-) Transcript_41612:1080-1991(-)